MSQVEKPMLTFWDQRVLIRRASLRMPLKLMLMVLHDYAGANGTAFPGQKRLADEMGCTLRSVQRFLRELHEAGFIEIDAHRGFCNRYRLRFAKIAESVPGGAVTISPPDDSDIPIPPSPTPDPSVGSPLTSPSASPDRSVVHNIQKTSTELSKNIQDENSLNFVSRCPAAGKRGSQERGDASRGKTNVTPHSDLLPTAVFTLPPHAHGGEKGPGSRERLPKEDWSTRVNPSKGGPPKKHVGNLISVHEFSKPFFAEVRFREAVRKGWCVEGDRLRYHTLWEYVHRHTTDPGLKEKLHNPPAFFMDALKNKRWHGQETDERKANQHLKEIDHTLDTRKKQFA